MVESLNNKVTPVSPKNDIFWKSAGSPTGVKSNLKSPVETIRPLGELIIIPKLSGIE